MHVQMCYLHSLRMSCVTYPFLRLVLRMVFGTAVATYILENVSIIIIVVICIHLK